MTDAETIILRELAEIRALLESRSSPAPTAAPTYHSTEEVAAILGKTPFTVREWCRLGRCHGVKRSGGDGRAWMLAAPEVARIRSEGLLPNPRLRR